MGCKVSRVQGRSRGQGPVCNHNVLLPDPKEWANSSEVDPPPYSSLRDSEHEKKENAREQAIYDRSRAQFHVKISTSHCTSDTVTHVGSKLHPVIQELQTISRPIQSFSCCSTRCLKRSQRSYNLPEGSSQSVFLGYRITKIC